MSPDRVSSGTAQGPASRLLHLLAALGLAVAQPLYEVLIDNPEFAIAHGLVTSDLWLITVLLSLGIGGGLWLVVEAVGLVSSEARWWSQCLGVGLVLGTMLLGAVSSRPAPLAVRFLLLGLSGGVLALAYSRSLLLRRSMSVLAAGTVVFPALFLWQVLPRRPAADQRPAVSARVSAEPAEDSPVLAEESLPPLVIVVFDELPMASLLAGDGTLDAVRYPNFAALAARTHWFRKATTVAQSTSAAVPAILTGKYPRGKVPPTAQAHPDNLFAQLRAYYHLNVVETMTALCGTACETAEGQPERRAGADRPSRKDRLRLAVSDLGAVYLAQRFPGLGPRVTEGWSGFWLGAPVASGDATTGAEELRRRQWRMPAQRFARFLVEMEAAPRVSLHYLHLSLPHVPWQYLSDGRMYRREMGMAVHGLRLNGQWGQSEWEVTQAQQRHLLQLQYADRLLGQLIDKLVALDRYDDSLIVVTADHGVSFQAGDRRRVLTDSNLTEIAHVPLFVKLPGQVESVVHDRNVETVDIAPTLAVAVGLEVDPGLDGQDLFGPSRGDRGSGRKTIYRSWMYGGAGRPVPFSVARLQETATSVALKKKRFPGPSLYAIGRDRHLIGRTVVDLPHSEGRALACIEHGDAFDQVDPHAATLPVHVMGFLELSSPVQKPQRLAIALDGVIRAVTETYGELPAARLKFTSMIDPTALRVGSQRLEVFVVSASGKLAATTTGC